MDDIRETLSAYITERDNYKARAQSPLFAVGTTGIQGISAFSRMIDGHHQNLFNHLPPLNLAELEALSELVNSRLSWVRQKIANQ